VRSTSQRPILQKTTRNGIPYSDFASNILWTWFQ